MLSIGFFRSFIAVNINKNLFFALFFAGIATLFRFQIGIVYVFYFIYLLFTEKKSYISIPIITGFLIIGIQIFIDYISNKSPLGTLFSYLKINQNGAIEFGTSAWYTTWLTVLAFSMFPLSLLFIKNFYKVLQKNILIFFIVFIYTLPHSLIPHKEERFLFPLVPLSLLILFSMWYHSRKIKLVKYFFNPMYVITFIMLFCFSIFSNSQESIVGPISNLPSSNKNNVYIFDIKPLFGVYGLREFFIDKNKNYIELNDFEHLQRWVSENSPTMLDGNNEFILLTSSENYPYELELQVNKLFFRCGYFEKHQSISDKILYTLNKNANERRMPSWSSQCVLISLVN